FSGPAQKLKSDIVEGRKFKITEETLDRRELMSPIPRKRGETLQKLKEESRERESH
ncbi:hypothetical protein L9F63_011631, partial [Diploptera punctata]